MEYNNVSQFLLIKITHRGSTIMINVHGFAVSNYYNMVKFALLEKGLDFGEVHATPSQESEFKTNSPMGKIPFLETEQGFLTETTVIMEYLEALQPNPALIPADAFAAAKVREIMKVLELYIELPIRRHFSEVLFGGERNEAAFTEVRPVMENGLQALKQLGVFKPYICGEFSNADIIAAHTFNYATPVCKTVYDWDITAEIPGLQESINATNARDAGKKVMSDHQIALQAFIESQGN